MLPNAGQPPYRDQSRDSDCRSCVVVVDQDVSAEFGELLTSDEELDAGHPVKAYHIWWQAGPAVCCEDLVAKT